MVFVSQHAPWWRLLRGVWNACYYYFRLCARVSCGPQASESRRKREWPPAPLGVIVDAEKGEAEYVSADWRQEGHPVRTAMQPLFQGGNRLSQVYLERGHCNGAYMCACMCYLWRWQVNLEKKLFVVASLVDSHCCFYFCCFCSYCNIQSFSVHVCSAVYFSTWKRCAFILTL